MPVALESLAAPELKVTIRGKTYPVKPIDGFGMQLAQKANGRAEMIEAMYKIAARCLGIPFAEVWGTEEQVGFSEQEVLQVVEVVQGQVKAVEATAPNDGKAEPAKGEERKTPVPPDSPQLIQSAL